MSETRDIGVIGSGPAALTIGGLSMKTGLQYEFQYNKRKTEGNIDRLEKELARTGEKKLPDDKRAKVTQELSSFVKEFVK